jgi:hypothetical protein
MMMNSMMLIVTMIMFYCNFIVNILYVEITCDVC